jgi:hypothetical protein
MYLKIVSMRSLHRQSLLRYSRQVKNFLPNPFGLRRSLRRLEAYASRFRDGAIAPPQLERDKDT